MTGTSCEVCFRGILRDHAPNFLMIKTSHSWILCYKIARLWLLKLTSLNYFSADKCFCKKDALIRTLQHMSCVIVCGGGVCRLVYHLPKQINGDRYTSIPFVGTSTPRCLVLAALPRWRHYSGWRYSRRCQQWAGCSRFAKQYQVWVLLLSTHHHCSQSPSSL